MKTIGVFDSGVGGLSVLRALLLEIPEARYVYLADGAHAPYGERTTGESFADRPPHRLSLCRPRGSGTRFRWAGKCLLLAAVSRKK